MEALKAGKPLSKHSKLRKLGAKWDSVCAVIRCPSRLSRLFTKTRQLAPMLMPYKHHISELVIKDTHISNGHASIAELKIKLREKYHIPKTLQSLKRIVWNCVHCRIQRGKTFDSPPFAPLPTDRVLVTDPWSVIGVDFDGPYKLGKAVDSPYKATKVWVALFMCSFRAIHVEVVEHLSSSIFMYALRRYVARRGVPRKIYSDNAHTFKGANAELKRVYNAHKLRSSYDAAEFLGRHGIEWEFIPSFAPWWGGFWERMVQTFKRHLNILTANEHISLVHFITLVTEAEGLVNKRPLMYHRERKVDHPLPLVCLY